MKIGNVELKNAIALAPMAGVTDLPFRLLCKEQGCGLMYTEMVSAKALLYKNRNTKPLLETRSEEEPVAVQLFGSDPEIMSEMALQLEKGMTDAQVQFLLGVPLIKDPFHENRWDYTYYLRRGNGEEQVRSLTVFFNEDRRVDHWTSDPLPDEQQADQLILGTIDTFEPRLPKTDIPAAAPKTSTEPSPSAAE